MERVERIIALFLRHTYLYKRSLVRAMEVFYWPLLDLLVWGFVSVYLSRFNPSDERIDFVALFLGALILWDILFRSQQGISVSFLEEVWSRNFLNLFITPLSVGEYIASLMLVSIFKIVLVLFVSSLLAYIFYSFNLFIIGISLIPFVANLIILGWAIGIITTALILRFGQQAEVLAWGIAFLFQPISAVFYPVSVLPAWLQSVARLVPSSHVFEGMRSVIIYHKFDGSALLVAFILNLVYLTISLAFFFYMFRIVRDKGLLSRMGE